MPETIQLNLYAYGEGRAARESGIAPVANPYEWGDARRESWSAGWVEKGGYFTQRNDHEQSITATTH